MVTTAYIALIVVAVILLLAGCAFLYLSEFWAEPEWDRIEIAWMAFAVALPLILGVVVAWATWVLYHAQAAG